MIVARDGQLAASTGQMANNSSLSSSLRSEPLKDSMNVFC